MKKSQILFQQHIGRMFREKWKIQRKKVLYDNGSLKELKLKGIPFEDANDVVQEMNNQTKLNFEMFLPKRIIMDIDHPDYHEEPCLKYSDHNVLLEGLAQAKLLTNSCEMDLNTLPIMERLTNTINQSEHDKLVQGCIKGSLMFDATQEKLPKRKDPERPAFVFPRDYGITERRKNFLLGKRFIQLCSVLSPQLLEKRRIVAGPLCFQAGILRDKKNVLLSHNAAILVTSNENIKPILDRKITESEQLPNIQPLSPLVSLETHNFFKIEDIFPINVNVGMSHIHTVVSHFNNQEVVNLYDSEVTESQVLGRSLMTCYIIALAQARKRFGKDVVDLPEPHVIQCVQMDSKKFHFSVFQLNTTAAPNETNTRNIFWNIPFMALYDTCDYINARPEFEGYNPQVFHYLLNFFQNS